MPCSEYASPPSNSSFAHAGDGGGPDVSHPPTQEHALTAFALPDTAARLRGVRSSPVRDILALTAREGVISFAGVLPAP